MDTCTNRHIVQKNSNADIQAQVNKIKCTRPRAFVSLPLISKALTCYSISLPFRLHTPKAIIGYKVVIHSVLVGRHNSTELRATFNYLVSAIQSVCSDRRQIFCSDSSPASIRTIALSQKGSEFLSRCVSSD